MKNLIETLKLERNRFGKKQYATIELNGEVIGATITNQLALDCGFDDDYDEQDNSGRIYESQEQAKLAIVNTILRQNLIELN
jgi:hypothetical protein